MLITCSQALLEYSFMSSSTVNMNTIGFDSCPLAGAFFVLEYNLMMVIA